MAITVDEFYPALDRRGNSELVRLIAEADHFRGTWRKMQEIRAERLAHLRRDPKSGESVLTARGEEIARQYMFARRLSLREAPP
jgi:hypothetical protein